MGDLCRLRAPHLAEPLVECGLDLDPRIKDVSIATHFTHDLDPSKKDVSIATHFTHNLDPRLKEVSIATHLTHSS